MGKSFRRSGKMPSLKHSERVVNSADLQRYKRLLLARLDELSSKRSAAASLAPEAGDSQGDDIDQANAHAEADLHIRLHKSDSHLLRAIEDALARISHDRFGVCEACGAPISKARLEAVPWTRVCRDCKEQEQSAA
jgi:DnaK suppressor protein